MADRRAEVCSSKEGTSFRMSHSTRREGTPAPLGASIVEPSADFVEFGPRAWNFALASRFAAGVELLLYGAEDQTRPLYAKKLDIVENRTGLVWHCRVAMEDAAGAKYYAYRVQGPRQDAHNGYPSHAHRFDPEKILIDPFAKAVFFPPGFDRSAAKRAGANDGKAPLGVLPRGGDPFSWNEDTPIRHGSDLVIYELHVRGFTMDESSGVVKAKRGTFAGLVEKIPYLKELGVTAVELLPVFQFDPQEGNFWGYMPISFFAVHGEYAMDRADWGAFDEFREMVHAMHRAGLEVIIDCVHNHTGEGGVDDVTYSQKGIDNASYYVIGENEPYKNYSGTGNAINGNSIIARQLLIESLRYWIEVMRIDGIRHDLASVVMRGPHGDLPEQPAAAVAAMAVRELGSVRHIVEPWDAVGAYQLGSAFPLQQSWQWNGKFRDDVRRFVRGDQGLVGAMMQRIYGSDDLFPEVGLYSFRPIQSVNFITSHDGFTLYDLVSYERKHNEANGHQNQDGNDHEHSWNNGVEGDIGITPAIEAKRVRDAKNLLAMLMLSAGTPMLRAGDEFLQTQRGNNNAYNQDNQTSWLDWSRKEKFAGYWKFVQGLIAFRKGHPSLGRSRFWREDVRWFGINGGINWDYPSRSFAFCLDGSRVNDGDLYAMINMDDAAHDFVIQEPGAWTMAFDTSKEWMATPKPVGGKVRVEARAIVVLARARA
jgi:isoamylase